MLLTYPQLVLKIQPQINVQIWTQWKFNFLQGNLDLTIARLFMKCKMFLDPFCNYEIIIYNKVYWGWKLPNSRLWNMVYAQSNLAICIQSNSLMQLCYVYETERKKEWCVLRTTFECILINDCFFYQMLYCSLWIKSSIVHFQTDF